MQRMNSLRRSLRDSFRRKRDAPESSKPHQWQADEEAVRAGTCTFHVKYLGCVEVFESRGMQICEEAMKVLRVSNFQQSRRRPVKSTLFISGDGLRVVEDDTKGLIVDQTIEKVSFCAPDRNHERGFSYICRDGTTRRWMCHGFLASKESGERLSHAVGCAFASCLERKQKREKECGVTMTYDHKTSTFTRSGSFRVTSMTESNSGGPTSPTEAAKTSAAAPIATAAIERPHAPAKMLERQGSFRGFSQLANRSPFKRQLSLRLNELPSNLQRTQPIQPNNVDILTNNNIVIPIVEPAEVNASPAPPPRIQRNRLHSLPNSSFQAPSSNVTNIAPPPSVSSVLSKFEQNKDLLSDLCQQVTQGLSMLAANHDEPKKANNSFPTKFTNPWDDEDSTEAAFPSQPSPFDDYVISKSITSPSQDDGWTSNIANNLAQNQITKPLLDKVTAPAPPLPTSITPPVAPPKPQSTPPVSTETRRPPAKLPANVTNDPLAAATALWSTAKTPVDPPEATPTSINVTARPRPVGRSSEQRPPLLSSASVAAPYPPGHNTHRPGSLRGQGTRSQSLGADPFDADWASSVAKTGQTPTNPFARHQTFQITM